MNRLAMVAILAMWPFVAQAALTVLPPVGEPLRWNAGGAMCVRPEHAVQSFEIFTNTPPDLPFGARVMVALATVNSTHGEGTCRWYPPHALRVEYVTQAGSDGVVGAFKFRVHHVIIRGVWRWSDEDKGLVLEKMQRPISVFLIREKNWMIGRDEISAPAAVAGPK